MQSDDEDKIRIPLCVMCGKREADNLESNESYDLIDRCQTCKLDYSTENDEVFLHSSIY